MAANLKRAEVATDDVAVYDGQRHLGDLIQGPCGVDAVLSDGREVGRFPNRAAASTALIAAAKATK
ncbi:MAG: hypothetical protein KDJ88_20530 [Bauldia sp.]|nr:hypothetical protein [Bauldia sp.]